MTFRVGQKVVCIETWRLGKLGYGDEIGPVAGRIYTIRQIGTCLVPHYPRQICVRLQEIDNGVRWYENGPYEAAFRASRFRPLIERKTDISFAHEILRKVSQSDQVQA